MCAVEMLKMRVVRAEGTGHIWWNVTVYTQCSKDWK